MFSDLLLLGLLWSLVEVHAQTEYPYVSFMGETLPNHGYVDLSLVGEDTDNPGNTVRCHTDLEMCCTSALGATYSYRSNWYYPSHRRVFFFSGGDDIYQQRQAQRVELRRRNNTLAPSGIYHCEIPTSAVHENIPRQTVYVGV